MLVQSAPLQHGEAGPANGLRRVKRLPETRQKILNTLGLLLCYRLGFQIPIPGMSPDFLRSSADQGTVFGLMSAFSGGAIGQTTIFALGIMPYISSSIIFSMLTKVSPRRPNSVSAT